MLGLLPLENIYTFCVNIYRYLTYKLKTTQLVYQMTLWENKFIICFYKKLSKFKDVFESNCSLMYWTKSNYFKYGTLFMKLF